MQDSISAFKRWEGTVQLLSLGPQANRISLGLSRCKARIILCCRAPNCSPSCILCSSSHHSAHCFTFPFAQRPAHVRCRGGERSPGPPAFIPRLRPLCSHTSSAAPRLTTGAVHGRKRNGGRREDGGRTAQAPWGLSASPGPRSRVMAAAGRAS